MNEYYKPCAEFDKCNELIDKYWESKQYKKCFDGHLELAEKVIRWQNAKLDTFTGKVLGCRLTLKKPFIGLKERQFTVIGTGNIILDIFTKTGLEPSLILKRQSTGTWRRHGRDKKKQ